MPQIPTGFNFTDEFYESANTTLVFKWDPPQGSGPAAIVDNYIVSIFPRPLSHPTLNNMIGFPPWNVTLSHNTAYNISITAINCAGASYAFTFDEIEYSKMKFYLAIVLSNYLFSKLWRTNSSCQWVCASLSSHKRRCLCYVWVQ